MGGLGVPYEFIAHLGPVAVGYQKASEQIGYLSQFLAYLPGNLVGIQIPPSEPGSISEFPPMATTVLPSFLIPFPPMRPRAVRFSEQEKNGDAPDTDGDVRHVEGWPSPSGDARSIKSVTLPISIRSTRYPGRRRGSPPATLSWRRPQLSACTSQGKNRPAPPGRKGGWVPPQLILKAAP